MALSASPDRSGIQQFLGSSVCLRPPCSETQTSVVVYIVHTPRNTKILSINILSVLLLHTQMLLVVCVTHAAASPRGGLVRAAAIEGSVAKNAAAEAGARLERSPIICRGPWDARCGFGGGLHQQSPLS